MNKNLTPKIGNIYTLKWKDYDNDHNVIFDGERDFTLINIFNQHTYQIKDAHGNVFKLKDKIFFSKYIKYKIKSPEKNICRFVDITVYGKYRKEYFGLQVNGKFYYIKDEKLFSMQINRDSVKINDDYEDIPINTHHLLIEKFTQSSKSLTN